MRWWVTSTRANDLHPCQNLAISRRKLHEPCGGYLAHPFANQLDVLLIASYFSELWHAQIKACKSISRVYQYHAEQTLFIFSCGGS
jgi:hypothetical protein